MTRLYFDDGRVRSFWHGRTVGRVRVTTAGPTGMTGRTTRREFSTAASARASLKSLAEKKRASGFRDYDPDAVAVYRPKGRRPATEKQLDKLAVAVGYQIPDEYLRFLRTANGGYPLPGYIAIPDPPYGVGTWGAGLLPGLFADETDPLSLWWYLRRTSPLLPDGVLPVAVDSDTFGLWLGEPHAVYKFDHEEPSGEEDEDGNVAWTWDDAVVVAQSFDEFLGRIANLAADEPDAYRPAPPDGWTPYRPSCG
ncbi:MAG: SMI1/KNR4 family protein [Planctomycetota bacterium]